MNVLSILVPLLAGVSVSAYSELLRGSHNELQPRRLDDGLCNDGHCNNGKCHSIDAAGNGKCKCENGWSGDFCDEPQCGNVDDCGDHGECKKDECDCDDQWEGDECDIKMEFEAVVIVVVVSSNERSSSGCHAQLDDFAHNMYDWSSSDLHDLSTVTMVGVPSGHCNDEDTSRNLEGALTRRRHLKSSSSHSHSHRHSHDSRSKGKHKHLMPIVMSLDRSDATSNCEEEIDEAAKKVKEWKYKDLKKMEGLDKLVELDSGHCNKGDIKECWKDNI